jgi:hypothetical protein
MPAMIDSNVLMHATRSAPADAASEEALKRRDCRALLRGMTEFCVSVITFVEYAPFTRSDEQANMLEFAPKMDVVALTPEAASLAVQLIGTQRKLPSVCAKCLSYRGKAACKVCGSVSSRGQGLADYMIIASAAMAPHVDVLYTYDERPEIAKLVADRVRVSAPPSAAGALWERLERNAPEAPAANTNQTDDAARASPSPSDPLTLPGAPQPSDSDTANVEATPAGKR